jgi:hypothetical protein
MYIAQTQENEQPWNSQVMDKKRYQLLIATAYTVLLAELTPQTDKCTQYYLTRIFPVKYFVVVTSRGSVEEHSLNLVHVACFVIHLN